MFRLILGKPPANRPEGGRSLFFFPPLFPILVSSFSLLGFDLGVFCERACEVDGEASATISLLLGFKGHGTGFGLSSFSLLIEVFRNVAGRVLLLDKAEGILFFGGDGGVLL